jgi:hypothetical protein
MAAALGLALAATTASASDWGFSFVFGPPRPTFVAPPPHRSIVVQPAREWVPAHYETRAEQILVAPARYEWQYVQPVYETRRARWGHGYDRVCIREGYWTKVYIPAQYETRYTQVLIAGYWREATCRDGHNAPMTPVWNRAGRDVGASVAWELRR